MPIRRPPDLARPAATPRAACTLSIARSRRLCLFGLGALLIGRRAPAQAALAGAVAQTSPPLEALPRALWVTRPQAQESVRAVYWAEGRLQAEGYRALTHIYRDLQANRQHPVALALLDLNFALQTAVRTYFGPRPVVLFSGYRTAATNARVGGVEPSIHATGQADDYIFEGLSLADNFRLARYFQVGGLGLYPERGSLHKDVGAPRSWITRGR